MLKLLISALGVVAFILGSLPTVEANAVHRASSQNKTPIPNWFLKDLRIAEQTRFPISASTYTLDCSEQPGHFYPQLNRLWFGVPEGNTDLKWFPFNIAGFYKNLLQHPQQYGPISSINVLETVKIKTGGTIGRLTPAMSIYWANGMYLAFANDKVIINNDTQEWKITSYTV